jgi:uncharacterized protein (DUF2147 family)
MTRANAALGVLLALTQSSIACAAIPNDMIGTWRWDEYTVAVSECHRDRVCARVIAGPKNVGLDIFATSLTPKDGDWVGQIVHPETKATYYTRFHRNGRDSWTLDGCTAANVCLSGEFVRVK